MNHPSPIVVAIALSLYRYNVSAGERALKLYDEFRGECAALEQIIRILRVSSGNEATELAYPTAKAYVRHAMERYGVEAMDRAACNERMEP